LFAAVEGCNSTKSVESHVNCITSLLGVGAQINAEKKGKTILMIAAAKGFIELVSEILSKEAWVNHVDGDAKSALHYSVDNKSENLDVVNLLIDQQADVNGQTTSEGLTPLMVAVQRGHVNITKKLIETGAKLDVQEFSQNNTALHFACELGHKHLVELLMTEHAFNEVFGKRNKNNMTAIDIAEQKFTEK
jgi:ankyrin repeat protein